MRARRLRVGPDSRHVFQLHLGLLARPSDHRHRLAVPRPAAVRRVPHVDAVRAGTVAPVAGQSVALNREKGEEEMALVVEGERDIASGPTVFSGRPNGREGVPAIGGIRGPAAAGCADDLIRVVRIDGNRRLAANLARRRNRDDVRARNRGKTGLNIDGAGERAEERQRDGESCRDAVHVTPHFTRQHDPRRSLTD